MFSLFIKAPFSFCKEFRQIFCMAVLILQPVNKIILLISSTVYSNERKIKQQHRRKYKGKVDYILKKYISKLRTVCSINSIYYKNFRFADND